ncbi:PBP1A family penicillin-binding protein [Prochlorococcus sp. MIT 0601]|uniref:transglycosylase domain-containing protein n=1 Tax=Prochlorococcus sp. MIT 0601 TaxID=1499498 RepID=UPI0005337FC5|nr:PBP1A family penicillin-binding protein [Prochlorococcus sp. MIT 0601]KGG12970.1 Multimodular transpeptidase-transglycosylase [Prochlorococcus sp. MIT 0601]
MRRGISAFFAIAIGSFTFGSVIGFAEQFISNSIDSALPEPKKINFFSRPGTITLLSANGQIIQKLGPVTRQKIKSGKMPKLVKEAFIAAEDRRYYSHQGVDLWGIGRALLTNIEQRKVVEGASTITQQLARIVFLSQERTYTRKLKEIALAYKLERHFTKEEILEKYLNNVYLGSNAYGIADASWVYFSKTPDLLTIEEVALIAGLPAAPSLYSPLINSDLAINRRATILKRMHYQGFISDDELSKALRSPLSLSPSFPKYSKSRAPFFTSWIKQRLPNLLSKEEMEIGGLTIKTSLNLEWQLKARQVLRNHSPGTRQGAIVSIENNTGLIRVLIGGKDFDKSQFNRATQAYRSPGSTFKVFPYAAAIQEGFMPEDLLFDTPRCWYGYCPKNFGGRYYGEVSIKEAFIKSLNTVAVDLLAKVGFKKVISLANQLGVGNEVKLGEFYPLAIGAYEENLLNMTSAYSGIANNGLYHSPSPLVEVRGPANEVIFGKHLQKSQGQRVLSPQVAKIMNTLLRKVVSEGTGKAASLKNIDVKGKTGTSEGGRDLWFIGSIPQLTTGIWLGYDNNKPTNSSSGESALIWKIFMREIIESSTDKPG